jgi:hypothetical protein
MTIVLYFYHILNNSTRHTKHKTFLNMAYIRQSPECMRQLTSSFEQQGRHRLFPRRSDVSHSALTGCVETNNNTSYSWARSTKGRQNILIFPST